MGEEAMLFYDTYVQNLVGFPTNTINDNPKDPKDKHIELPEANTNMDVDPRPTQTTTHWH